MYNRYIPRDDGSYTCEKRPEPGVYPPPEPEFTKTPPVSADRPRPGGTTGFLQQLLGKNFDTGDLMVILLLLLMAGDSEKDRNTALLTIALYFMM